MDVLSFDSEKIHIDKKNNIVRKKSQILEYEQIKLANDYFEYCPIILNCGLKIRIVPILGLENEELLLHFCRGLNLEQALRYNLNRRLWVSVLKELLIIFQRRGFMWGDIAPRNMIFDEDSSTLYILDFEKKLIIRDATIDENQFSGFFRRYAYEELSCLLNEAEQKFLFHLLLSENIEGGVSIEDIFSGRKKALLRDIFGDKKVYSIGEINVIEDAMSFVATPVKTRNGVFYPMFLIEKITKKGGYYVYTEMVKKIWGCSSNLEKISIIKSFS